MICGSCAAAASTGGATSVELDAKTFDCSSEEPSAEATTESEWLRDGRLRVRSWEVVTAHEIVDLESGAMRVENQDLLLSYQTTITSVPSRDDGRPVLVDICPYFVQVTFLVSGLPKGEYTIKVVSYPIDDGG